MHAIADCNNFFVSCERLFNPSLNGKAVVVLSGNDGCIIARSNEAKALGIPMGCPAFKLRDYTTAPVVMLSARHILYRDISCRIMSLLSKSVEHLKVYSVDEAFFVPPCDNDDDNYKFLCELTDKIYRYVGIPVSIGYAPTMTLAKIANHIAKKDPACTSRVKMLTGAQEIEAALMRTPIDDVWGIGRRLNESLRSRGITTAWQFTQMPKSLLRNLYSSPVVGTQQELMGHDSIEINPVNIAHKSIMNSRTFAQLITSKSEITAAVVTFAQHCAKQLREERTKARTVTVRIRGDVYRSDVPFYSNSCSITLPEPSSSAMTIAQYALMAFNNIFKPGYHYRKAGVMVSDIVPEEQVQPTLFHGEQEHKQARLMKAVDGINRAFGKQCVTLAPSTGGGRWRPKQEHKAETSKTLRFFSGASPV